MCGPEWTLAGRLGAMPDWGGEPFSSLTISPSRMYRIRVAIDAASGLWVIMRVVWPNSRFDLRSMRQDGFGVFGVQVAGGLVCQDYCRAGNEGGGNGYTLLFAAAQLSTGGV